MSEWIGVGERLPEPDKRVLVWFVGGSPHGENTAIGWLSATDDAWYDDLAYFGGDCYLESALVTHWRPMPEGPKEEGTPQEGYLSLQGFTFYDLDSISPEDLAEIQGEG